MEQFRTLLKMALAADARRVCIKPHVRADWLLADGSVHVATNLPIFEIDIVSQLIGFLFPNYQEQAAKGDKITGTLQIPNVGVMKLLAKPVAEGTVIYIYTPAGEKNYDADVASEPIAPQKAPPPVSPPRPELPPIPVVSKVEAKIQIPAAQNEVISDQPTDMFRLAVKRPQAPSQSAVSGPNYTPPPEDKSSPPKGLDLPPVKIPAPAFALPDPPSAILAPHSVDVAPDPFEIPKSNVKIEFDIPSIDSVLAAPRNLPDFLVTRDQGRHAQLAETKDDAMEYMSVEGNVSHGENPIDALLADMVQKKASDMHLTSGQPVILRIDGEIRRQTGQLLEIRLMESLLMPTFSARNKTEFAKTNDTDFAYELKDVGRFRVNVFRDRNGMGAVLRHIPSTILTAEQLKLPPAIMNLCKLNKGLVLVTGPTGSGKSTTLAAMIDWINKNRSEHILTIEDPIEFVHQQQKCLINQREVHRHTGSFSRALKAALREDPNTILIGEMRDLETISIAIETAETGHLVFGTLHTTTAISTVDRIIDQFPADRQSQIRTMLASSLRGVVTQTLLKKNGGGRIAAHEILMVNDAVASMIREGKIHMVANHMMTQKADGNQLLNDCLFKLIADGSIDVQEALFKSVDKNDFILAAARKNIKIAS